MELVIGYGKSQLGETPDERRKPEMALHTGQRCAEAEMDAVAEREMPARRTADVECLGVVELVPVTVRSGQRHDHLRARRDGHIAELEWLGRVAKRPVRNRRVITQQLLDRRRDLRGFGD